MKIEGSLVATVCLIIIAVTCVWASFDGWGAW